MQRLVGKRALVTGGSSGIGRAIALRFVQEGADVTITGRRRDALEETVRLSGGHARAIEADHADAAANAHAAAEAARLLGGLDVLVNNAGVIGFDGILEPKPDELRRLLELNLVAVYEVTRHAVPHLLRGNGASVLNLSSVAGLRPYPGLIGYCVSKAGLDMMTQCLALELAPRGVRVNAINPGVVVTDLHKASGMEDAAYQAFLERCRTTHPLGRVGTAEEIAALATFLSSDEAGWITGALHSIDGGRAITSLR